MNTAGPNNYLENELRNCRLANHSAPKGAAIYVNGEHRKGLAGMNAENPLATSHGVITADKRAFSDYRYVWLIDYHCHAYTNLLDEDYTVALPAGNYDRRFALRIGGYPLTNEQGKRQYVVFVYGEQLHIHGLVPGDFISVYAPTGQLVTNAVSSGTTFTTPLPVESGYVVRVNDYTQKVVR